MGNYTWSQLPAVGSAEALETNIRATLEEWRQNFQAIDETFAILSNHYFADNTARDAYFSSNPSEKTDGVYVWSDDELQKWDEDTSAWLVMTAVIKGETGDTGATGAAGPAGATLVPEGAWDSGTTYSENDVVTYNGSAYYANAGNTNKTPGVDSEWTLFVSKGDTGAAGAAGADGADGEMTGPGTSTDNAVVRFDGIDGTSVQNSLVTIDDSGGINLPSGQTYNINGSAHTHDIDALLPSQTGNSGKFLTTDGTDASWGSVSGYATTADVIALAIALGG